MARHFHAATTLYYVYVHNESFRDVLGVETHDTERRRQIALKALSERLNKSESTGGKGPATSQDWPSLDGDDESKPVASSTTSPSSPRPAPAIATVEATEVVVVGEQKAEEAQPLL